MMITPAEEENNVEVRREDQTNINKFARLNARLHELRGERKVIKVRWVELVGSVCEWSVEAEFLACVRHTPQLFGFLFGSISRLVLRSLSFGSLRSLRAIFKCSLTHTTLVQTLY